MITFKHITVLVSSALAIVLGLVLHSSITDIGTASNIPVAPPVAVTKPVFKKSPDQVPARESDGIPVNAAANSMVFPVTEHNSPSTSFRFLAEHNLEQLYSVIWQVLDFENAEDPDFQTFVLATLDKFGDLGSGKILAVLIHTAPTTELKIDALRLLAEASQELSVTPFDEALNDSDSALRQVALEFFDELSADIMLAAVTDVLQNGNQRERLVAFTTLEEMHRFAPVWEVAYSVLDDPDPRIRMRAMELLTYGDRQVATDQLLLALNDPNADISDLAEKLLTGLEETPS